MQQKGGTPGWLGDCLGCFFVAHFSHGFSVILLMVQKSYISWGKGSLSHYLQGFGTIQSVVVWDFWTINSRDYHFIAFVLIPCQSQFDKGMGYFKFFQQMLRNPTTAATTTTRWQNPKSWSTTWQLLLKTTDLMNGMILVFIHGHFPLSMGWHSGLVCGYTPRKLTWNLKISPWKRKVHLETIIFRFHVKFRGCTCFGERDRKCLF